MLLKTLAVVGRVSNLPTLWTNILAAAVLSSAEISFTLPASTADTTFLTVLLAISLMYLGGMYMNDAIDYEWDLKNNNPRPIVKGEIRLLTVWLASAALLLSALGLLAWTGDPETNLVSISLSLLIILYNTTHKKFPSAALLMGLTRFCAYLITALALSAPNAILMMAATGTLLYITGVTYLARSEHRNTRPGYWPALLLFSPVFASIAAGYTFPIFWLITSLFVFWIILQMKSKIFSQVTDIRSGIGSLLAAIPLNDALYLASINAIIPCLVCIGVFLLMPHLHRYISGT